MRKSASNFYGYRSGAKFSSKRMKRQVELVRNSYTREYYLIVSLFYDISGIFASGHHVHRYVLSLDEYLHLRKLCKNPSAVDRRPYRLKETFIR